jgi:hypothetical protein
MKLRDKMKLNLGIIIGTEGTAINHRSLLKIVVNPFLRFSLRICVASVITTLPEMVPIFHRYTLIKGHHQRKSLLKELSRSWIYSLNEGETVLPIRRIF